MSKSKKLNKEAIVYIQKAIDIIEGQYSNIPECCIKGYLSGRTYMNVRNCLTEKEQKKYDKWNYVPCEKCFKKNQKRKINLNGASDVGNILFTIMDILRDREDEST